MFARDCTPHYDTSNVINNNPGVTSAIDLTLPILPANCVWQMNANRTGIVAVAGFAGGGGSVVLPSVPNKIAYFTNATGTLASSIYSTPVADGNLGDSITTDGAGQQRVATLPGINRIINGDFQIWQRGAGGAAAFLAVAGGTTLYTADRWQFSVVGGGGSGACSQIAGATSGSYVCKVQRTAGNAVVGNISIATSLTRDMGIGAAGNKLTLSFKAFAGANFSAAGSQITVQLISGTGANDVSVITTGFAGQAIVFAQAVAITPALTNYSITTAAALPANITQLAVIFQFTPVGVAGVDDSFSITDVQLEISDNQSPFERKSFAQEIFECQTFFSKSFIYSTVPAQNIGIGTGEQYFTAAFAGAVQMYGSTVPFPRYMRNTPVMTIYNPAAANAQIRDEAIGADFSLTNYTATHVGFRMVGTGDAGTLAGNLLGFHWIADIDLL
jgi:hypothetical protein